MAVAETTTALTGAGVLLASACESARAVLDYEPWGWLDSAEWAVRRKELKQKYGRRGAMPKSWSEVPDELLALLSSEVLEQCKELLRLGHEAKAIRLAFCARLGTVWICPNCGRPGKKASFCKSRMCLACAKRNFDRLFKKFLQVDSLIPAAVRSQPGWGWHVLDFSFRHDGDYPTQEELRAMVKVIRRTVGHAVQEARAELYQARKGCRLRLNPDGSPMVSVDGWPVVGARDGEARELVGWEVLCIPEHDAPDNGARKRGVRGAKKKVPATWKLRFGYELLRVTEFGFDSVNAHFHCAYFGPCLDYWKNDNLKHLVCGGRLVDIFKEESGRELGEESYTVFLEKARRGFRSVLAHALKYTAKLPASTGKGLAQLEHVLDGTRRVALLGAHYGVPLESKPRSPKCSTCGAVMARLDGLGLVPISEIEDLPDVGEDVSVELDIDEFLEEEVRGP